MSAPASQHLSAGARHHSGSPSDGQPAEQAPVQQRKSVTYANVDVEDMSAGEYEEYDPGKWLGFGTGFRGGNQLQRGRGRNTKRKRRRRLKH